eukprot:jgi/Botrbrau1/2691/Bobra.0203s0034.1
MGAPPPLVSAPRPSLPPPSLRAHGTALYSPARPPISPLRFPRLQPLPIPVFRSATKPGSHPHTCGHPCADAAAPRRTTAYCPRHPPNLLPRCHPLLHRWPALPHPYRLPPNRHQLGSLRQYRSPRQILGTLRHRRPRPRQPAIPASVPASTPKLAPEPAPVPEVPLVPVATPELAPVPAATPEVAAGPAATPELAPASAASPAGPNICTCATDWCRWRPRQPAQSTPTAVKPNRVFAPPGGKAHRPPPPARFPPPSPPLPPSPLPVLPPLDAESAVPPEFYIPSGPAAGPAPETVPVAAPVPAEVPAGDWNTWVTRARSPSPPPIAACQGIPAGATASIDNIVDLGNGFAAVSFSVSLDVASPVTV